MINSTNPVITSSFIIGGSFLILTAPEWLLYMVVVSMIAALVGHWIFNNREKLFFLWRFAAEFCGFCLLIFLFLGSLAIMNQILGI